MCSIWVDFAADVALKTGFRCGGMTILHAMTCGTRILKDIHGGWSDPLKPRAIRYAAGDVAAIKRVAARLSPAFWKLWSKKIWKHLRAVCFHQDFSGTCIVIRSLLQATI